MPDQEDRWIPTSQDVSSSETESVPQERREKRRHRLLRSLTFRRRAGAKRTEVSAPTPELSETPSTASTDAVEAAPAGAGDGQSASPVDDQTEAPSSSSEADSAVEAESATEGRWGHDDSDSVSTSRRRSRFVTPRRLGDSPKSEPKEPPPISSDPDWWPKSERLGRALVAASEKGHIFSGVETESNGTQIWRCTKCGRAAKREFEQADRWPAGVGTWALKMDVAGVGCG